MGGAAAEGPVLRTLLVFDLAGGTETVEEVYRDLLATVHEHHPGCSGIEVATGVGRVLLCERPLDAVRTALALQHAAGDAALRAGVHLSEVELSADGSPTLPEGVDSLLGSLLELAGPRQTLLTRGAFDLARRAAVGSDVEKLSLQWVAHGSYRVPGSAEPVEIFEVGEEGFSKLSPPAGSEEDRQEGTILGWRPAPGLEVPHRPHWVLRSKLEVRDFSEAWLAEHRKTRDTQVFKFCFEEERLRGLQREVTIFRLLKDALGDRKDIARILDWNFDEAPYFVEAEYSKDGTLPEWLEEQGGAAKIPLADRLEIVAQVADALAAAHSVGVLHKDIRPESILISVDQHGKPRTCLTGFGVGQITEWERLAAAKITVMGFLPEPSAEGSAETTSGIFVAPEIMEGKTPTVQADIYALGVILYQLVVGDFKRALAPGWYRNVQDELLFDDIAVMVDGQPERRLADAAEVARRLRSLQTRRAERQAEQECKQAAARALVDAEQKRRRAVVTAVALLGVLVLIACGLLLRAHHRVTELRDRVHTLEASLAKAHTETEAVRLTEQVLHEMLHLPEQEGEASLRTLLDRGVELADARLQDQPKEHLSLLCAFADAYRGLGMLSEARTILQRAAEMAEQHPESYELLPTIRHDLETLEQLENPATGAAPEPEPGTAS